MSETETRPTAPKPKLRWYQYRLRTLFLVILLASIGLSWPAARMYEARRQRDEVRAILKIEGCEVAYDGEDVFDPKLYFGKQPPLPPVTWTESFFGKDFVHRAGTVGLPATRVDEVTPHLRQLPYLRRVVVLKTDDSSEEQVEAAAKKIEQDFPDIETVMLEFDFDIKDHTVPREGN
jgi:hypothetical protein